MNKFPNLFVIIPAYNEEKVLGDVLDSLTLYFQNIVIVNDGSTDGTKEVIESSSAILINHAQNLGAGAAIRTGLQFVSNHPQCTAALTFDADGQHQVEDAIAFATEISKCNEDIIFGSRFLEKSNPKNMPTIKKIVLKTACYITNYLTRTSLTDTHNGMKAIKQGGLKKLELNLDSFAFDSEIIYQVSKKKLSYKELPTNTIYTKYSKNKGQSLRNGFIILEDLLSLLWRNNK